jgi:2'-hydroxyisoflavone reductase
MNILIIGGTRFVGRAIAEDALARGHQVTLFHRGQTNPDLFPGAEHILGDRDGELTNLGDRQWDAVIDTCGYVPRIVGLSAEYLKDRVKRYIFISTISVYSESTERGRDEDAELATLTDETTEEITGETYGGLKVLCEQIAERIMPGRVLVIRPGLIVGPHDPTNRFTYWPVRVRRGGDVLVPGDGSYPAQFIDVRDLAAFTLHMTEQQATGIFNATGPDVALTLMDVLKAAQAVTGSSVEYVHATAEFLAEKEVAPWMEMPLWIPSEAGAALMAVSVQRGIDAGMRFRPLAETIRDTLAWYDSIQGDEQTWSAGMKAERETELIAALKNS